MTIIAEAEPHARSSCFRAPQVEVRSDSGLVIDALAASPEVTVVAGIWGPALRLAPSGGGGGGGGHGGGEHSLRGAAGGGVGEAVQCF